MKLTRILPALVAAGTVATTNTIASEAHPTRANAYQADVTVVQSHSAPAAAYVYTGHLRESGHAVTGLYDLRLCRLDDASYDITLPRRPCVFRAEVPVTEGLFILPMDDDPGFVLDEAGLIEIQVRPAHSPDGYTILAPRRTLAPLAESPFHGAEADRAEAWRNGVTRAPLTHAGRANFPEEATAISAVQLPFDGAAKGASDPQSADVQSVGATATATQGCGPFNSPMVLETLDADGDVGWHTAIAIGSDGLPVISYLDFTNFDLKVAHCNDAGCNSAVLTAIDSIGNVGSNSAIAIGADGLPVISYLDATNFNLKIAHCNDTQCSSATLSTIDSAGSVGFYTAIAIGTDSLPVISYWDATNDDLKVAHCDNASCSSASVTVVDSPGSVGWNTSIVIGSDGFPVISYYDVSNGDLKVAHCDNPGCSSATLTAVDSGGNTGDYSAISIGADGLPVISYQDVSNGGLKVAHCNSLDCGSATLTTVDVAGIGGFLHTSIAIGIDGLPVISYFDGSARDLKTARCGDVFCNSADLRAIDTGGNVGEFAAIAIGSEGLPIISYYDGSNRNLKVARSGCLFRDGFE